MKVKSTTATTEIERGRGPVTEDQIRQRAYEIFLAKGASPGQDVQDWLRAERELQSSQDKSDQASPRSMTASGGPSSRSTVPIRATR
jgi:hypothetical protein